MEKISTTETAPEAVAVAKQLEHKLLDLSLARKIALLENIKDAGNLGTIIRSAVAFGIDGVVLCGDVHCHAEQKIYCLSGASGRIGQLGRLDSILVSLFFLH